MKITTILPVSRTSYLDRVLESLKNQTYKIENLLVIFDGNESEFLYVRNKIGELPFDNVLTVPSQHSQIAQSTPDRRRHIANIHNQIRGLIEDAEYIFSVEDDGILPPHALSNLVSDVILARARGDKLGMVTGVELGRWGTPYVGAWRVDDVFHPTQIESIESKAAGTEPNDVNYEEIDGCGLYCALIDADLYKKHNFFTHNGLGPDVNLGLFLRQEGYKNFIDWSIHVTHVTFYDGNYLEIPATSQSRTVKFTLLSGSTWKY